MRIGLPVAFAWAEAALKLRRQATSPSSVGEVVSRSANMAADIVESYALPEVGVTDEKNGSGSHPTARPCCLPCTVLRQVLFFDRLEVVRGGLPAKGVR